MSVHAGAVALEPSDPLYGFRWLIWSLYVLSWVAATRHVASHPAWNLDGVFYSALMAPGAEPPALVHQHVYEEIEARVPADAAVALTQSSDYRQKLHRSAKLFSFQLPFYVGKPLYLWLGRALTALGVPPVLAPYRASALGFAAIGLLLPWLAMRAGAKPLMAAALSAACMWLPELRDLGALATPDAVATALLVLGALVGLSSSRYAMLPLSAAVLTRPDAAILACGVACASCMRTRSHALTLLWSSLLLAIAWAIVPLTGAYAWPTVMRHTFMDRVRGADDLALGFGVSDYVTALDRGLHGHMTDHPARFAPYLGVAVITAWWAMRLRLAQPRSRAALWMLGGTWLATMIHFFALPLLADRFFASAYVCTIGLGCALLFPAKHVLDVRVERDETAMSGAAEP